MLGCLLLYYYYSACRLFWLNAIQVTKSGFHYVEAAYTENIILNRYPWVGLSNTITVLMAYECRTSSTSIFSFQKSKWFEKAETINERRNQPEIKAMLRAWAESVYEFILQHRWKFLLFIVLYSCMFGAIFLYEKVKHFSLVKDIVRLKFFNIRKFLEDHFKFMPSVLFTFQTCWPYVKQAQDLWNRAAPVRRYMTVEGVVNFLCNLFII